MERMVNNPIIETRSRLLHIAFVLDADKLRRLEEMLLTATASQALGETAGEERNKGSLRQKLRRLINGLRRRKPREAPGPPSVAYTVKFEDGATTQFNSREAVTTLDNAKSRPITEIGLSVTSSEPPYRRAYVTLANESYTQIYYAVSGPESYVAVLPSKLEGYFDGISPWYSPITVSSGTRGIIAALLGWVILVMLFVVVGTAYADTFYSLLPKMSDTIELVVTMLMIFVVLGALFGLGWLGNKLRRTLFPFGLFLIGDGKARYESLIRMRRIFVGAASIGATGTLTAFVGGIVRLWLP